MNASNLAKSSNFAGENHSSLRRLGSEDLGVIDRISRQTRNARVGLAVETIILMAFFTMVAGVVFGNR